MKGKPSLTAGVEHPFAALIAPKTVCVSCGQPTLASDLATSCDTCASHVCSVCALDGAVCLCEQPCTRCERTPVDPETGRCAACDNADWNAALAVDARREDG